MGSEPSTERVARTVCSHDCPDSCAVLVTVRTAADGSERAVKVAGDPTHPVTRGFLCGKVARYLDRVYAPDRLLYPMRRRAGVAKGPLKQGCEHEAFERITWDEALDYAAGKLQAIAAEHGPESILPYSYAGTIGQLGYGSMDRRFFHRLGASQLDRTICAAAGGAAYKDVYGVKVGAAPEDFARAGLIIAWGANIHGNNVHLWPFVEQARRRGARLVVIDPYKTRTAALADEHMAINPGTDGLLALGLMHVIFRMGLEDKAYLAECTHGHEELRAFALRPEHAPERVCEITGVAATSIVRLAREYAQGGRSPSARPAIIRANYGLQRSENGGTAMRAILMLPLLTGSWKRQGGGVQMSLSGSFPFDAEALQRPDLMLRSPLGRPARVVNMNQLGTALTAIGTAAVKALVVYNANPAAVTPNQSAVLAGMRRDDLFTVVHEQFFTDTADYADLLLPAVTFLETKDVQGSYGHRFLQLSEQAIEPLGEARSNTWFFGQLAQRMGFTEACFRDSDDDLIDQALGGTHGGAHPWLGGVTRQELQQKGRVEVHPAPMRGAPQPDGPRLPFATADWFETPSGKGELLPVPAWIAPGESRANASAAYPLEFLPRKADNYMNSTFANQPGHQHMERATAGLLEMHAADAAARGVAAGDEVEITNDRGRIRLRASLSGKVAQGVVAARLDWTKLQADGTGNVNQLTSERLTDLGGGATFYSTLVEVSRVGQG